MIYLKSIYKRFPLNAGLFSRYGEYVYAVNGVTIGIEKGESYGLVGESGSGKTTLAKIIAGIHTFDYGQVIINGKEYSTPFSRPQSIQYIFQDPATSLNPRHTIFQILTQGYRYHASDRSAKALTALASQQFQRVGLSDDDLYRRPVEFSGGQRQRIAIARALMYRPEVLICDEIVSALDVSIRAQIINLLLTLRNALKITMLFIAHDLSLVTYFCDRVGVLYKGVLVEEADSRELLKKRYHPYTERLFHSIPYISNREDGERDFTSTNGGGQGEARKGGRLISEPASWKEMRPYHMREAAARHYVVDEEF